MTARQPIFTGSDEDTGTIRTFRREKVLCRQEKINSWFKNEVHRRMAVLTVFESVWSEIDFENMRPMRRMKIWDEFSAKVLAATHIRTRYQFLNELCRSFGVQSLNKPIVWQVIEVFNDDELLNLIRDELQYLILLMRDKNQQKIKLHESFSLEQGEAGGELQVRKTFDYVPVISGNSIRGILRRIVMRDFCNRVGVKKLKKDIYHQLFTGGSINDSTEFEDIAS